MSQSEKSPSLSSDKAAVVKSSKVEKSSNIKPKKGIQKGSHVANNSTKAEVGEEKKPLTQGQKLLKAMTAQKAAKQALMKGVEKTHVTFDEEGNEANAETIVQRSLKEHTTASKGDKKEATKKKAQQPKKRKVEEVSGNTDADDTTEKVGDEKQKKQPKKPKKSKKEKKEKQQVDESNKKESKQAEALAYVRLFVEDRASWKFRKLLQTWLLQNLYEIPESDFDNVLIYLKDIQGVARESTKKEAENKISASSNNEPSATAPSNNGYDDNDADDFDAEKLLAMASGSVGQQAPSKQVQYETSQDDSDEIKRAKLILNTLS